MNRTGESAAQEPGLLAPPLRVHRAGEATILAEYPNTHAVLAAAAAIRVVAPPHLLELVPAERTLLLAGTAPRDLGELAELLRHLPAADQETTPAGEQTLAVAYDGEDLAEAAELLGLSTDALIAAHTAATWTAAFGGFTPGFAYLMTEDPDGAMPAPLWDVPRRAEPRTTVPTGAVGLASRYCGIYPRSSPGGWQLIGRTDAELFDPARVPPALLTPGTRVQFTARRPTARVSRPASTVAGAGKDGASGSGRRARRRGEQAAGVPADSPALEVLSPGPLALLQDGGRPGRGAIGVSPSGAFDRGALMRANLAVGNPVGAAAIEALLGPIRLRACAPTVVAVSGASAPLIVRRRDPEGRRIDLVAGEDHEVAIALDPGDELELGPVARGLRLMVAVRGGICAVGRSQGVADAGTFGSPADGAVLGSLSRDTLSGLGPDPLGVGSVLLVGPQHGLDAVPDPIDELPGGAPTSAVGPATASYPGTASLTIPVHPGPRDELLGTVVTNALVTTAWTVRPDSDRVGVRLEGTALRMPVGTGSLPSEAIVPGAIQMPPSGLPVVFGPDHPTTGGYPVIAVVTRAGLDRLAQAAPGVVVRFVRAD